MRSLTKAIVLSLLLVLLYSQNSHSPNTVYTLEGQQYLYTYGSGANGGSNTPRSEPHQDTFVADSTLIPVNYKADRAQINCPRNQVYNNILCECVCIRGYYMHGGICYPNNPQDPVCGKHQVYKDKRCVCDEGYYLIGTICHVCPPYSTYILNTLSCECAQGYTLVQGICRQIYQPPVEPPQPPVPQCKINEELVNNICRCKQDFYLVKGVCTYCVSPNTYDAQLAICRPTCGKNEQLDLTTVKCVCIGGYKDIRGVCGTCPAFSIYNKFKKRCDCIYGYTFSSGMCIPKTRPPTPPVQPPKPPRPCVDENAYFVNGQCICRSTYHLINGVCQQCSSGFFFDATLSVCRLPCNANQVYNIITSQCDCAPNYFRMNEGGCSTCSGNSTYNSILKECTCPGGYRLSALGNCVAGCGQNEIFQNGKCCCKYGYYPVNGACNKCAWNEVYDQGLGICRIPCDHKRIFDLSLKKCVCLPQYFELDDGTCDICPVHSTYSETTKKCECNLGYIMNLGLCTPKCNNYEMFVDGKCVCKEGYYLIGYTCGVCPPTEVYDSTYRICHSPCKKNEVWDPIIRACRCLPAYYLVGGICSQCDPKTQVYNQKHQCCECISGYRKTSGQGCHGVCIPICSVNEDWIGNRCVCKPGYHLINNYCTKCPDGQFYDIYQRICRISCGPKEVYNFHSGKCDCAQGYYLVNGVCSKCAAGQTYDEYTQTCSIPPCPGHNEEYSPITQTCICKPRYIKIRGVCTNCNPGYYYDSYSDRCLCKPGFRDMGGYCKAICPDDQNYVNGRCQCKNGLPLNSKGECRPPHVCPMNAYWNKKAECCICNPGFRVINGKCSDYQYCGENGYLRYGQCYCKDEYFWILNACRRCGQNEAFNGVACECYLGYHRNYNGHCVLSNFKPNCFSNERYDQTLKACVCIDGTQYIRGKCETIPICPANAYYNSIECVCNAGYKQDQGACVPVIDIIPECPQNSYFNGVSCTCKIGFFQQDINSCAACPPGTSWNGRTCANVPPQTCDQGYVFNININQCEPIAPSCGDNAYFNGATCICLTDYHFINGVCQKCPSGTAYDGAQCKSTQIVDPKVKCGSNQVVVNDKCVCNAGLYLINGKCLACPAYTTFNGKYCVCGCNTSKWCLGLPFSQWNSSNKMCMCQKGYLMVNGLCTVA